MGIGFGTGAINSLISLGITANASADGTISLDADTLSNALDNNFSQVVSFFQDSGKFGSTFMQTLDGLGTSSFKGGAIALALKEDSSQENDAERKHQQAGSADSYAERAPYCGA